MKRLKKIMAVTFLLIIVATISTYAANEITIETQYEGIVKVNEEKNVSITLKGVVSPLYTNVRMNVEVQGPAKPKLMATDSSGNILDIMNTGYWGPEGGFPVQGDFTNTTPVKATFTEAGNYIITLTLINVANGNAVLTSKTLLVQVESDKVETITNTIVTTNELVNNEITELPKTGISIWEYALYATSLLIVVYYIYRVRQKNEG